MSKVFCIYTANFLPSFGGVEKFTDSISRKLVELGCKLFIVTNNIYNLPSKEVLPGGIPIYRLPCHSLINGRLPLPKKNTLYGELTHEIEGRSIDYIILNTRFYPLTIQGAKHAAKIGSTAVLIDHGSSYLTMGNHYIDAVIRMYEHAITHHLKQFPIHYYGVSRASLEWLKTFHIKGKGVINNSIDADLFRKSSSNRDFRGEFGIDSRTFLVAFTGRLVREKGVMELIEAAKRLIEKNVSFILAGDGPLKSALCSNRPSNIHLTGAIEPSDIASLLTQADAFCLPSRSEGFSTSLLEAAACCTTPIITKVGGTSELIPSKDFGIVLPSQSPSYICDAIEYLQQNPDRNKVMGANVGKRARSEYSWKASAERLITACEKANPSGIMSF